MLLEAGCPLTMSVREFTIFCAIRVRAYAICVSPAADARAESERRRIRVAFAPQLAKVNRLLLSVLKVMQEGKAVSIVPQMQELTTQRAANLLGVSRQFFVRLLDGEKLPFHRTGTHRRVYLKDVLEFRKRRDQQRKESIERIAKEEVTQGTYDDFPLSK
jgi:excisionase family DNA binding protein